MCKKLLRAGLIFLSLLVAIISIHNPASAQSSAGDLVNAVNALRAARGLSPYQVDGNLMAFAKEHSEYQASIGTVTHTHIDGSTPEQDNVFENVAEGLNLPAETVVNQLWSDSLHQSTMIGIKAGYIGAGVATSNGVTYYTIDIRKTEGFTYTPQVVPTAAPGSTAVVSQQTPASTPIPFVALATATPHSNGMVIHIVGYGQTLFNIALAYGVTVPELQNLNNMASSTNIYAGQKLLIRAPNPALATAALLTATAAHVTPTVPHTATATRRPTATRTASPTRGPTLLAQPSPTLPPAADPKPDGVVTVFPNQRSIGIGLIILCLVGLSSLGLTVFRKK
jgi:LysM repeat protein